MWHCLRRKWRKVKNPPTLIILNFWVNQKKNKKIKKMKNSILKFQGRVRNTMTCRLEDEDGLPFYTKKCMTVWYFISCIIHMITIWIILCFNIVQSLCYFQKSVCCHTLSSRAQASRRIGPSKLYPPLVQNTWHFLAFLTISIFCMPGTCINPRHKCPLTLLSRA